MMSPLTTLDETWVLGMQVKYFRDALTTLPYLGRRHNYECIGGSFSHIQPPLMGTPTKPTWWDSLGVTSDKDRHDTCRLLQTMLALALQRRGDGMDPHQIHTPRPQLAISQLSPAEYAGHARLVSYFMDSLVAPFSIHRMVLAALEDRPTSPFSSKMSILMSARAIKTLVDAFPLCGLGVHLTARTVGAPERPLLISEKAVFHASHSVPDSSATSMWGDRPVLILVQPVVHRYDGGETTAALKHCLTFPQSLGIVAGGPDDDHYIRNKKLECETAWYLIGTKGTEFISLSLDKTSQKAVPFKLPEFTPSPSSTLSPEEAEHYRTAYSLAELETYQFPDDSLFGYGWDFTWHGGDELLIGFLCRCAREWLDFRQRVSALPKMLFKLADRHESGRSRTEHTAQQPEPPLSEAPEVDSWFIASLLDDWVHWGSLWVLPGGSSRQTVVTVEKQLVKVEQQLCTRFLRVLDSTAAQEVVLSFQSEQAQQFLDLAQRVLDLDIPVRYQQKARDLIMRLSSHTEQLPETLFVTGITDVGLHALLGGAFGDVYRATYDGQPVAVKRVRMFIDEGMSRRKWQKICKEAIIWQGLKHELVLPFFGVDKEIFAPTISLISPWMNEGTVLAYLGRHGRQDAPRFTREVAEALAYLHTSKVVHGDLRGANILISNVSPHHVLLADFGLASVIRDEDADLVGGALTSSSHAGNIRWWAPELCSPSQFGFAKFVRTPEVDAWAFGWVCCELVTGEIPFAEMNEVQAMREVIAGHRPERPEGMGIEVWEIVCAVWAEKADARPGMAEIVSWLREV